MNTYNTYLNTRDNKYTSNLISTHLKDLTFYNQSRTYDYQDTIDFFNSNPKTVGRDKVPFNLTNVSEIMLTTLVGSTKLSKGLDLDKLSKVVEQLNLCQSLGRQQKVIRPAAFMLSLTLSQQPKKWANLLDQFKTCLLNQVNKSRKVDDRRKLKRIEFFMSYVGYLENSQDKGEHIHLSIVIDKHFVSPPMIKEACKEFQNKNNEVNSAWVSKLEKSKLKKFGKDGKTKEYYYVVKEVELHDLKQSTVKALAHFIYIVKNYTKEKVRDSGKINNLSWLRKV